MKRKIIIISFLILFCIIGVRSVQFGSSIHVKVVDSDGKPLDGVIATAVWTQEKSSFDGNIPSSVIHSYETITDNNGEFDIPKWGPEFKGMNEHPTRSFPSIFLFKDKYKVRILRNNHKRSVFDVINKSDWDKKTVKLKRYKDSYPDYYENISRRFYTEFFFLKKNPCEKIRIKTLQDSMMRSIADAQRQGKEIRDWPVRLRDSGCD
jgi:hypothetical protein